MQYLLHKNRTIFTSEVSHNSFLVVTLEGILVPECETVESGLFCCVKHVAEGRRLATALE